MKNKTYKRRRNTVSTWKKSAARIVLACQARNARQVSRARLGEGSMPASSQDLPHRRRSSMALENGELVAQDEDLRVLGAVGVGEQGKPAEHAEHRQISDPQ